MGQALAGDQGGLAPGLELCRAVLRFCPQHPQDDLHHQCGRGAAPKLAQDHQDPRQLPNNDAALKLLYLTIKKADLRWRRSV